MSPAGSAHLKQGPGNFNRQITTSMQRSRGIWRRLLIVSALAGLAGLALINQPYYPASWQDEGFALQGAMNLVRYGQYAMRSSEGFRVLDQPLLANGPGLVFPLSSAFSVLGIDLVTARLVMVVYFVATAALFFAVARRLFGTQAALISTVVLLALPGEDERHARRFRGRGSPDRPGGPRLARRHRLEIGRAHV